MQSISVRQAVSGKSKKRDEPDHVPFATRTLPPAFPRFVTLNNSSNVKSSSFELFNAVKLDFFRSYVSSAAQAVLAKGNSVPGLPAYQLGERKYDFDGQTIWSLHDGLKRVSCEPSIPISEMPSMLTTVSVFPMIPLVALCTSVARVRTNTLVTCISNNYKLLGRQYSGVGLHMWALIVLNKDPVRFAQADLQTISS